MELTYYQERQTLDKNNDSSCTGNEKWKKDIQDALVAYYKKTLMSMKTSKGVFLRK